MQSTPVLADGSRIRWIDLPGEEPARIFIHGLGASAGPNFATAIRHPLLNRHRSLLVDMLGFGFSDRPADFDYTLESHADAVAAALKNAELGPVDLIGHSMGGAVAIVLAHRHPNLVRRLVVVDGNLDRAEPDRQWAGSRGIASYTEAEWLSEGWQRFQRMIDPEWLAAMRLGDPIALHRSAVHLARATTPPMRELLMNLTIPRTFLVPGNDGPPPNPDRLTAAGVTLDTVADSGHVIMRDNPDGFARAVAEALV